MDVEKGGVISPGGIGFDINCGMRLVKTGLFVDEVAPRIREVTDRLLTAVPAGVGSAGFLKLSRERVLHGHRRGGPVVREKRLWLERRPRAHRG